MFFKISLLLACLTFISCKTVPELNFDIYTEFDENTNNFQIKYNENTKYMVLYAFHNSSSIINLVYSYDPSESQSVIIPSPGGGALLTFNKNQNIEIKLTFSKNSTTNGKLYLHDLEKEIEIDFSQKYGFPFAGAAIFEAASFPNLTYSITKLNRDISIKFDFQREVNYGQYSLTFENPFKVCQGTTCQENIKSYDFKKGGNYKISIKIKKTSYFIFTIYGFPTFSFYEKKCATSYVLMPNGICNETCSKETHVIQNENECGLCKDINNSFPYKMISETFCRKEKPKNSYNYDKENNILDYCDSSCETCSGKLSNQCLSCKKGSLINNICYYNNCPDHYYLKKNGTCGECSSNCLKCDGPSENDNNHCILCDNITSNYSYLVEAIGYGSNCVDICPENTILDNYTEHCIDIPKPTEEGNKLLWLWITLSVIVVLIIILISIFLFKRICSKSDEKIIEDINKSAGLTEMN